MHAERRFKHQQFLQRYPFANGGGVFRDEGRKLLWLQPYTRESMTFGQDENWVQADLFQGCRKQERRIEAGCQSLFYDLLRRTDFLALRFKTGWRQSIGKSQPGDRRPDGGSQFIRTRPGLCFVAVQPVGLIGFSKHLGRGLEDTCNRCIVGLHKHGEQLCHAGGSTPFTRRKNLYRVALDRDAARIFAAAAIRPEFQQNARAHSFLDTEEELGV